MSWYSIIYTYGRALRAKSPVLGISLQLLFYVPLLVCLGILASISYIYVVFVCRQLTSAVQISIYVVIYFIFVFMLLWSLVQTIITRVARVPAEFAVDDETDAKLREVTAFRPDGRPALEATGEAVAQQVAEQKRILDAFAASRSITLMEIDKDERLRYCYTCRVLKPDRAHHCSSCGFCSLRFDHHCPYINRCIGFHNYKYYVLLLLYIELWLVWTWTTSIEALIRFIIVHGFHTDHLHVLLFMTLSTALAGVASFWPIGALLHYHWGLIVLNETTCEQAKIPLIRGDDHANYDLGRWRNVEVAFGWGLWLFPVNTRVGDGLHHPINYVTPGTANRMVVAPLEDPDDAVIVPGKS